MKRQTKFTAAASVAALLMSALPALAASEPVVSAFAPNAVASVNAAFTVSANVSDPDGVQSCHLFSNGVDVGSMELSKPAGVEAKEVTATFSQSYSVNGWFGLRVRCVDTQGNFGMSSVSGVTVGPTSAPYPVIGAVTPLTAVAGSDVTFNASVSDTDAIKDCTLVVDGDFDEKVTISGSGATLQHTFAQPGTYDVQVRCTDAANNIGFGQMTSVYVTAPTSASAPTIGIISPTTATVNQATTFTANVSDDQGVASCNLFVDGADRGAMTLSSANTTSGTASFSNTFSATGSAGVYVKCVDKVGNEGVGQRVMLTTFPAVAATTGTGTGTGTGTIPQVVSVSAGFSLDVMNNDAGFVFDGATRAEYESRNKASCEWASAAATTKMNAALGTIADVEQRAAIDQFVSCGTFSTMKMGAGERLGIVNSYKAAFGRLPNSQADWFDVIKIGNGRFPGATNDAAMTRAKASFKKVYLRDADTSNSFDNNAVTVMAYGLRPLPRNLNSEAAAIVSFRAVYGRSPTSATDWDIVRAIAYSGASR